MAGPWEKYRSGTTGIPIGPQVDPMQVRQADRMDRTESRSANTDQARLANEAERLRLAQQAQRDAAVARQQAQMGVKQARDSRISNLNALAQQINRVDQLYKTGVGATKGIAGALDYLPTPGNKKFDAAGAGLAEMGLSAFRVPGVGSQSDKELKAFVEANRPMASDYDEAIQEKLRNLKTRLREAYKPFGVDYGGSKPAGQKPQGGWKIERLD